MASIKFQMAQCLKAIRALPERKSCNYDRMHHVSCYLVNITHFLKANLKLQNSGFLEILQLLLVSVT